MSMTIIWIGYQSVRDHFHRVLEISASPRPPELLGAHGNRFKKRPRDNRRIATEETSSTRMIQIIAFLLTLTVQCDSPHQPPPDLSRVTTPCTHGFCTLHGIINSRATQPFPFLFCLTLLYDLLI